MAQVPQVQAEGSVFQNIFTSGAIPERFLKRGMDNLGNMAFITRGYTKFLSMLHTRFPKAKTVTSRQFPVYELSELDRVLNVTVASTSTDTHASIGISNAQAAQVRPNDILYVKGLFMTPVYSSLYGGQVDSSNANPYGATHLNYSTGVRVTSVVYSQTWGVDATNSTTNTMYEAVMVLQVDSPDSAGTGNTKVVLRRGYASGGKEDFGGSLIPLSIVNTGLTNGTPDDGTITTSMQLLRGLPSFPEGTDAPTGVYKNPLIDNNFTQEYKYALEITKESTIEALWMNQTPLDIARKLRMRQANIDQERTFIFGRKSKSQDSLGRQIYTTGGVVEFILPDTDHFLVYNQPTINYTGTLDLFDKAFNLGGSSIRYLFCGIDLYREFKKSFWSSGYLRYDEEATDEFAINISVLDASGGQVYIIPLYTLQEAGWGMRGICLDMETPSFVPVTHEGYDMKVEQDIAAKGQQIYKEQWLAMTGLERRYQYYQTIVSFE